MGDIFGPEGLGDVKIELWKGTGMVGDEIIVS